ncbi:MAG: right-handed parallel beta-helix repeat-containing protein [Candidatus Micrarchaeota archaeon]|nr:right-handed parallel beta-helix repeat-containing protein [Candidatus Micrarchaeota archaeon]
MRNLIFAIAVLSLISGVFATNITACGTLGLPGTYTLTNDVNAGGNCFVVKAKDVVLDCQGHSITGNGGSGTSGVYTNQAGTVVKNCNIYSFSNGVYLNGANKGRVLNSVILSGIANSRGILANNSTGVSISKIGVQAGLAGVYLSGCAGSISESKISGGSIGVLLDGACNSTIAKNTITTSAAASSQNAAAVVVNAARGGNYIYENRLVSSGGAADLMHIEIHSEPTMVLRNNFTDTTGKYLVARSDALLDTPQLSPDTGNIYYNVLNGSVNITGTMPSGLFPGLYIGSAGSDYPYGPATSQGKIVAYGTAQATDYAPLTANNYVPPVQYGNLIVKGFPTGAGTTTGTTFNFIVPATLPVSAIPNAGYAFSNWNISGNCAAANPSAASTTVTVSSGNCYATAIFLPTGNLIVNASPSAGGIATGSAYNFFVPATLPVNATANTNYAFAGWIVSGSCTIANASAASTTVTVNSGTCYATANFNFTGCVCGNLNVPNYVCNVTQDLASAGTCFNVIANNVTILCNGHKITGANGPISYGIYSEAGMTTVDGCNVSQYGTGLLFSGTSGAKLTNSRIQGNSGILLVDSVGAQLQNDTGISVGGGTGMGLQNSTGNSLVNVTVISNQMGIDLLDSDNNAINGATASGSSLGIDIFRSNGNILSHVAADSASGYALRVYNSNANSLTASQFNSYSNAQATILFFNSSNGNLFANNTISHGNGAFQGGMLFIDHSASGNLFYWNNFTAASGRYVDDMSVANLFNTTINGRGEGNIYANVMNGSVQVQGNQTSSGYPSLYIGINGTGYPYDYTSSQGKVVGMTDFAPLTPNYYVAPSYGSLIVNASPAAGGAASGTSYNFIVPATKPVNATANAGYVFTSWTLSGSCTIANASAASTTVTVTSGTCYATAIFNATGNLIVNASPANGGITTGTAYNFIVPATKPVAAAANANYTFLNWGVSGSCTVANASAVNTTVTVNSGTCYATAYFNYTPPAPQGCVCGVLSVPNYVCNITQDLSSNSFYCMDVEASNVTIECNGHRISKNGTAYGTGIYADISAGGARIRNCNITGFDIGMELHGSMNNVTNSYVQVSSLVAITSDGDDAYLSNVTGVSQSNAGISIQGGNRVTVIGSTALSTTGIAMEFAAINGRITNVKAATQGATALVLANIMNMNGNDTVANSDFTSGPLNGSSSWDGTVSIGYFNNNTLANNTIRSTGGPSSGALLTVAAGSVNNTIYWNNFTQASGYYIKDIYGGNYYNAMVGGKQEGNIYANVMNGSVKVQGNQTSSGFPALYIGMNGTGYPYSQATAQGKIAGSATDYAPLTPNYYNYTAPQGCVCGINLTTPNYVCNVTQNLSSSGTCFNVQASNVTIQCNGHSITGPAYNYYGVYGVYSNQSKTTVKDCVISMFDEGVLFDGVTNGIISGVKATNASNGIYLASSSNNIIINSTSNATGAGIALYSSSSNTIVNSSGTGSLGNGIILDNGSGNSISNSAGTSAALHGIAIYSGSSNTITNSSAFSASGTGGSGLYISSGSNNTILNSNGTSSSGRGISIYGSNYSNIANSIGTSLGNDAGVWIELSSFNAISNSAGSSPGFVGFYIVSSSNNIISNVNGTSISGNGFGLFSSSNNIITSSNGISNAGEGIFLTSSSNQNTIINSHGTSNSSVGIVIDSSLNNTITNSVGTSNANTGIQLGTSSGNIITGSNGTAYVAGAGIVLFSSTDNMITSCVGIAIASGQGIILASASNGNRISQSVGSSANGPGVYLQDSSNNIVSGLFATSASYDGMKIYAGNNNTVANSTISSFSGTFASAVISGSQNKIINNTFVSGNGMNTLLTVGAAGNLIYWNNFTSTNGYYIQDLAGGNIYNATINGKQEGNIYANVLNGSVQVQGNLSSLGFPALYIGMNGTGYPYNSTTSQGKISGNAVDYAPLTPYYFNNSSVGQGCVCGNLSTPNYVCNVTQNLASNGTCFNVQANNVTILCNGHSISGANQTNSYGVYSNQQATAVKNCIISNYYTGVFFDGATGGSIFNTNTSSTYLNGNGIWLGNGADSNTVASSSGNSATGLGIILVTSSHNTIANSKGTATAGQGILLITSSYNTLSSSIGTGGHGIGIGAGSDHNTLINATGICLSTLNDNAIYISASSYNTISNSTGISANGPGIQIQSGSSFNIISNSIGSSNSSFGIYLYQSSNNTISGSLGASSSDRGILLDDGSSYNSITSSNGSSNTGAGIFIGYGSSYNNIANSKGASNTQPGIVLTNDANYNTIANSKGTSNTQPGISLFMGTGNKFVNTNGTSTSAHGINLDSSSGNAISNCSGTSGSGSGIYILGVSGASISNTIANSTFLSYTGIAAYLERSSNSDFYNNTLKSASNNVLLAIHPSSGGNTFYWNNFTSTSGHYIQDFNGSNRYNTTINGKQEGNIYANVMNGSVQVQGNQTSSGFPALYIGMNGTGYPYSQATSQGGIYGNATDYAPLTPYYFNNSSTQQGCQCGVLNVSNYVCNVTSDLSSNGTCFDVEAYNVTILCNGHSITGSNNFYTYGIYSADQNKSRVKAGGRPPTLLIEPYVPY